MIDKNLVELYLKGRLFKDLSVNESESVVPLADGGEKHAYTIELNGLAGEKTEPRFEVLIESVVDGKYYLIDYTEEFMNLIVDYLRVVSNVVKSCDLDCSKYL